MDDEYDMIESTERFNRRTTKDIQNVDVLKLAGVKTTNVKKCKKKK